MPDDDHVGAHRVQRHCGVDQSLALFERGDRGGHVDHIRPQPLPRDLERQQRAGGVLEECVDLGEAGKASVMLGCGAVEIDPLLRLIKQEHDLMRLKPGDAKKMPMPKNSAARDLAAGAVVDLVHRRGRLARARGGGKRRSFVLSYMVWPVIMSAIAL